MPLLVNHTKSTNTLYWNYYLLSLGNCISLSRQLQNSTKLQNNSVNSTMLITVSRVIISIISLLVIWFIIRILITFSLSLHIYIYIIYVIYIYIYIYLYIQYIVTSWRQSNAPIWGWVHWIVFMTSLYMYYALCFVHIEHSVCHEPIFVLID